MKYLKNIIYLLGFISFGCSKPITLDIALELAGENREELEKVLTHYGAPEDSLKYKAACFLIENMPSKHSIVHRKLDDLIDVLMESVKNEVLSSQNEEKWQRGMSNGRDRIDDIHVITADYLIENIDFAFEVWGKPWNHKLSFNDFCELILPYRIGDEPLTNWRKLYYNKYVPYLDSIYAGTDVVVACNLLARQLKETGFKYYASIPLPRLSADFLFHNRVGECREACDIAVYAMRACGIPVAIDYFIYSPEYQQGHTWNVVRDSTDQYLPFWFTQFEANREMLDDGRKKGKVYRDMYSVQTPKVKGIWKDKSVPNRFKHPFRKDVTDNYTGKNRIEVPLSVSKVKYAYLGAFSPQGWIPVDMGIVQGGKAVFHNLEPALIYQTLNWDGRQYTPAGYPFLFSGGKVHLFKPDIKRIENVVLKRKMSLVSSIRSFLYRNLIGARIEGSNTFSFIDPILFYQINDTLTTNYNEFIPLDYTPCRYIRYKSPPEKQVEFAELFLYNENSQKPIPKKIMTDIEPVKRIQFANDGDILSYFQSRDTSCYVVFDLGKPIHIDKMVFYPRNDDNYVWPGDVYELFYQDGTNGWKSLSRQTAKGRELYYEAPGNAVLWLRNLTKGKEEQLFIYKDGKQLFNIDIKDESF